LAIQSGERVEEYQQYLHQPDGRVVPVLVNAVPVQDADGNFTRGLAVFQDITALKELERHKDEFISVASHELRGPLTVIRGQAQLLQRQLRRQEKQGEIPPGLLHILESMESIESQTARLNDLVNDLLDVSRIQAGKLTIQRGMVALTPLITKVIEHWKPASDRHTLILETGSTEQVVGRWDARRVEQILNNLIGNALKYSPEGGVVNIRVWVEDEKKQVMICVQDQGLGIPPEALPHLFERFYRAGNVSSIGGTGLGLYISRQLAVVHGGDIWAESPGVAKGSTFYLRLPLE
jgi:two-component system, OmpR family, sensor kinase